MSYYDNVKDNVKGKKTNSAGAPSFDTLKEAAEETSVEEEESNSSDDTPIEVLEEGGLRDRNQSNQNQSSSSQTDTQTSSGQSQSTQQSVQETDLSSVEEKLDKMIEQNQKIIDVLESFGS